ncbi:MAG: thiamine ABC transporter substrate-binding protein [Anaerolineaceae bacterium]|nr:thiamine ABC transporter substrate-binding protein [Anaerolineaceae bacterium]
MGTRISGWVKLAAGLAAVSVFLAGCAPATPPAAVGTETLTVMTHDSFAVSESVMAAFEQHNNVKVQFLLSGDTGSALNRAILARESPLADVFYGVDNTFLSRALEADLFEVYNSPLLESIPAEFRMDEHNRALPVDYGDVCINYDKAFFEERSLAVPQSLEDLTKPEYRGLLVVQNPATSSPGLAFMLATVAEFGETGFLDYWRRLRANEVTVVNDWEVAYYTQFSASSGRGPQPMVVSYSSSPAAEVVFAPEPMDEAPTASITAPGTCFRQVEFVGILSGTPKRALAEKFVNFLLSVAFQEDLPLQMFVYPVNPAASLPDVFIRHAAAATQPARLDAVAIAANRDAWIEAWDEVVLR